MKFTRRILSGLCSLTMFAAAFTALGVRKGYVEVGAEAPSSGIIADFTAEDTTVEIGDTLCTYETNVDTDGDGSPDAATALKYADPSASWNYLKVRFNNPVTPKEIYTIRFRFYVKIAMGANTKPLIMWKSFTDVDTHWMDNVGQGEWAEIEFTREETLNLVDPADGKIKGLIIGLHPGSGVPLCADPVFMLDSASYDPMEVPVTMDNDKANTGVAETDMVVTYGETLPEPTSQVFGKVVTWYADPARTVLFDFENTKAAVGITLYGKYENIASTKGVVSECTRGDTRYLEIPLEEYYKEEGGGGANGVLKESCISYVTDVDTDGDGVIDAESAIKVSNWTQWHGFALEFATPVDMSKVSKVTFRVYFDLKGIPAGSIWEGPANFQKGIKWLDLVQNKWWNVSFSSEEELAEFTGESGLFDHFGWVIGFMLESGQTIPKDAYMLIDKITYEWDCTVNFDCDTANSGVNNFEKTYISGKKISSSPKATQKEGYDVEWYLDAARTIPYDITTEILTDDITLYAKYVEKQLTVTFLHDEAVSGIAQQEVKVKYGEKVAVPANTLGDYTVTWYEDEACTIVYNFDSAVTDDITLYAKYVKNEKKGCKSSLAGGTGFAIAAIVASAFGMALRKKEED